MSDQTRFLHIGNHRQARSALRYVIVHIFLTKPFEVPGKCKTFPESSYLNFNPSRAKIQSLHHHCVNLKYYVICKSCRLVSNTVLLTIVLSNTTKYNLESELKCLSLKFVLKCSISSFNKPLREKLRWNFVLLELVEVRLTYHSTRASRFVSRFFVSL